MVEISTPPKAKVMIGLICFFMCPQSVCNEPAKSKNPNRIFNITLSIWVFTMKALMSPSGKSNQNRALIMRIDKKVERVNRPITKGNFK